MKLKEADNLSVKGGVEDLKRAVLDQEHSKKSYNNCGACTSLTEITIRCWRNYFSVMTKKGLMD